MENLASYEFVEELSTIWRSQRCSLLGHFGYIDNSRRIEDWVIKFSPSSGQRFLVVLPFEFGNQGWFDIVGIDKGVFCLRLSKTGEVIKLVMWNPITQRQYHIEDPLQPNMKETTLLFSFLFLPQTVNYTILSILLQVGEETNCLFTTYDSRLRIWSPREQCPAYVRNLDPAYVALDGVFSGLLGLMMKRMPPHHTLSHSLCLKDMSKSTCCKAWSGLIFT
ncbi:hypothetical protein PIB30_024988 [Stylosanthes scabra]|uniref:Uncharacterized protein n=1 Tax=Stylosanthes scabra TaxID=79078 RepID=A0ABU6Y751_9FABA|nr:hypothetical protein [Stylosanthes scabra]